MGFIQRLETQHDPVYSASGRTAFETPAHNCKSTLA